MQDTINTDAVEDAVSEDTVDDITEQTESVSEADENLTDQKKPKKELPAWIKKIVDYLKAHEDIRQMVFFLLFSVICGASQMIVTYGLSAGLKLAPALTVNFSWFIFIFDTTAEFIGFLVGSIVGQVLTFILNRKKTFNVPDYIALRAVLYAIMAVLIIIMQTALGGAVTTACYGAVPENEASEFLKLVFNLTGQAVAGIAAVIVNFLGNKFFVMRDWGKKKRLAAEKAAAQQNEVGADVNADTQQNEVSAENGETNGDLLAQAASDNIEE